MVSAELENALVQMEADALDALKYLWAGRSDPGLDVQQSNDTDVKSEKKSFWRLWS